MPESISSSVLSRVVAGVLISAVLGVVAFVPEAFDWLSEQVSSMFNHFKGTSALPNWGLYILGGMSLRSLMSLVSFVKKDKKQRISEYIKDDFFGLVWRWSYTGKDTPIDIWAFCPICDTCLVYAYQKEAYTGGIKRVFLTCERCNQKLLDQKGDEKYLIEKVHRQIDRKIRNGEWEDVVNKNV